MDLNYSIQGEGSPIIMIHSPGVDSREWNLVAPILGKSYQVITFDARGTGRSPAPQAPLDLVEDLRQLLESLDFRRATLVGHSMGGQVATDFSLTYPAMVECLVLIAPSLSCFAYSPEFTDWLVKINALAPEVVKMVELSLAGPNYRVIMASPQRDFLFEMHTQYMTRVFTEWKSFELKWPQPPAIERLESITARTLFIQGNVEWADMLAVADQFKRVPSIKFVEIENADHMLALTHPEELASSILHFLAGNKPGPEMEA